MQLTTLDGVPAALVPLKTSESMYLADMVRERMDQVSPTVRLFILEPILNRLEQAIAQSDEVLSRWTS